MTYEQVSWRVSKCQVSICRGEQVSDEQLTFFLVSGEHRLGEQMTVEYMSQAYATLLYIQSET